MYSACLFCHSRLGANEVIESFPIGRRLAFDAAKGRLWVVCAGCGRWNLTPLEERWEAIEDCEGRFRDARMRASTDQIGVARLKEGLELVRIGRPHRPEMAAWRYGREFLRRHRLYGKPAKALTGAVVLSGVAYALGAATAVALGAAFASTAVHVVLTRGILRTRVAIERGRTIPLSMSQVGAAAIIGDDRHGFALRLPHDDGVEVITGDPARRAASVILARINRVGGSSADVARSVEYLEGLGSPDEYLRRLGRIAGGGAGVELRSIPSDVSLGLEMATHEEEERRALEGELAALETAWQDAEEIAAIADRLLIPSQVSAWMSARKRSAGE